MIFQRYLIKIGYVLAILMLSACGPGTPTNVQLFDGHSLEGWEGSDMAFRVDDGSIVGGNLENGLKESYYLCTKRKYGDFDLSVMAKFNNADKQSNAGISFRATRIAGSNEVAAYQADMGHIQPKYAEIFSYNYKAADTINPFSLWGTLVDECRGDPSRYPNPDNFPAIFLEIPKRETIDRITKLDGWNNVRIIAKGTDIEIKINDVTTVKYTEKAVIPEEGCICLQAHSGSPYEIRYKDITIKE